MFPERLFRTAFTRSLSLQNTTIEWDSGPEKNTRRTLIPDNYFVSGNVKEK